MIEVEFVRIVEVAPRAGAWIETCTLGISSVGLASPLAQGRGLKHHGMK